ncbi:OB-fold putative lipoprotein [Aquimarina sp. ERC-38]|uniref:OB-fold protein n=1 Tax=Aquimarina sp. ERC-38 TaxID=2949996 RepID=UPI002245A8A4|nr:hypothetical protein [Aquimarina sp. ERC-38]UZO81545.1 OB-fold putative lipoprotein [Aquimarina sp. ERC-38]
MKLKIVLFIIVSALVAFGIAFYMYQKKVPGLASENASYQVTANELFDAFNDNEEAASQQFLEKVIAVTGEVVSIKENNDQYTVVLHADNAMAGGINCSFRNTPDTIEKGATITIKGRCQGFLMDVVLNNCVLEK